MSTVRQAATGAGEAGAVQGKAKPARSPEARPIAPFVTRRMTVTVLVSKLCTLMGLEGPTHMFHLLFPLTERCLIYIF